MMNERSSATVLVRVALFLREQRRDAVGELHAECCLERQRSRSESSATRRRRDRADCRFEAVEAYALS